MTTPLDPATLRAVAAQLDREEAKCRGRIERIPQYGLVAGVLERIAGDLLKQARQIEQEVSTDAEPGTA